ncbi:hypothetical protein ABFP60_12380 [Clostridioides difficile]
MKRLTSLILATTLSIGLFNTVVIKVSARGNDTSIQQIWHKLMEHLY